MKCSIGRAPPDAGLAAWGGDGGAGWYRARAGTGSHRRALSPGAAPGILRAMRLSNLFFTTLRDDPAEAEMASHRLLVRAGYIRQLGAGIYSLLPLGFRVSQRIEQVIREEMNAIGGQEMEMPVVHPADLWRESGRYAKIGPEMVRFKDRGGRDMVLAMTHEEVVADLLRDIVQSYRQLPIIVYHFQTKFRDEPRSRGGLIRVREFVMKDSYSCDRDEAGPRHGVLGAPPRLHPDLRAPGARHRRRGRRCRDHGRQPGARVHVPQPRRRGRPRPLRGLRLRREPPGRADPRAEPAAEERCPGRGGRDARTRPRSTRSRRSSACPTSRTAKAAFFVTGDGRLVVAIVRGDYDVNETKLVNAIKAAGGLRPAQVEEIRRRAWRPATARRSARATRSSSWTRWSRSPNLVAGREPARLPPAQRQRAAGLHAGRS